MAENFFEYFHELSEKYGDTEFLKDLRDGKSYTFDETLSKSLRLAEYLDSEGVGKGDKVSIFVDNCPEWRISDLAVKALGAVNVSRYTEDLEELEYVHEHSDSSFLIHDDGGSLRKGNPSLKADSFDEVYREFEEYSLGEALSNCSLDDLSTIVYTSGTKTRPKGVMLTHENVLSQVEMVRELFERPGFFGSTDLSEDDGMVSLIPEWHMYQRTVENYAMSEGITVYYDSLKHFKKSSLFSDEINIVPGVPRLWTSLKNQVEKEIGKKTLKSFYKNNQELLEGIPGLETAVKFLEKKGFGDKGLKDVYDFMYDRAVEDVREGSLKGKLFRKVFDKAFGERIREKLGDMKLLMSGGSYLPGAVEEFFNLLDLPIGVGYGATETSPLVTAKVSEDDMYTIGKPMKGVDTRINENSVLEVSGPNVFQGYYHDEGRTEEVFTDDGYFITGDKVEKSGDSFRYIEREDDLIVRSDGENVSPSKLESAISAVYSQVKECMVFHGSKLGFDEENVAVVVPSTEEFYNYLLESRDRAVSEIREYFRKRGFSVHENIERLLVYSGDMEKVPTTPTEKMKRDKFIKKLKEDKELLR